jgi:hypothetical protein
MTKVDAPIHVLRVGDPKGSRNQAIVALAVRTAPSAVTRSVFVSVANFDLEAATRRVEVWGDDHLLETRTIHVDAQQKADVIVDDVPAGIGTVEVRLASGDDSAPANARPDLLAIDDRAWAVVPPERTRNILLVGPGDPYLETALSYLPNSHLFGLTSAEYPAGAVRTDGTGWDLVIFEGALPPTLPASPILAIAPTATSALGVVSGTLDSPGIGRLATDDPILRYVDLSTTHIAKAAKIEQPAWARTVIPGPKGAPLLYSGVRAGLPTAVLAFEPRESDLPLQVGFPILMANLTGELLGGSAAPTAAVRPGDPVVLTVPSGASGLHVTRPDGSATDLLPGAAAGSTVTYTRTDVLGVYTATPIAAPTSTGAPSSGAASSSPRPASPAASPAASPSAGAASDEPIRFAVDLFDVNESAIAPGSAAILEQLGRPAGVPGASGAPGGGPGAVATDPRPNARDEIWIPIVFLVLVGLCVEWAVYHRDAVLRGWRGVTGRLRATRPSTPPPPAGGGR